MSKTIIFIQAEGKPGVTEAEIAIPATVRDLHEAFKMHGIDFDKEREAFVDEADNPVPHDDKATVEGLEHGSRVHVTHCKKIKVTINGQDQGSFTANGNIVISGGAGDDHLLIGKVKQPVL